MHSPVSRRIAAALFGAALLLGTTTAHAALPLWFSASDWFPDPASGRPSFATGDFNALFQADAKWPSANIQVLLITPVDIAVDTAYLPTLAQWATANPSVKIGINTGMLAVGGSSCGARGEGVSQYQVYNENIVNAYKKWKSAGGRVDLAFMDAPLTAGMIKCGFTLEETVRRLVPTAQQLLALYPNLQFSLEQGPARWSDGEWLRLVMVFFQQFQAAVGKRVSNVDMDMHLCWDVRKPPVAVWDSVSYFSKYVATHSAVKVGLLVNGDCPMTNVKVPATPPKPPPVPTSAAELVATIRHNLDVVNSAAAANGTPIDHVLIDDWAAYRGNKGYMLNNLPATSPSALTYTLLP